MTNVLSESLPSFQADEAFAQQLDANDPLRSYRAKFHIPLASDGQPFIYFCGNSLGLQPKATREIIDQELTDWANLGVEGHFHCKTPWYSYHEVFRETGARLVGGLPGEVVMMNSLTVNLHLMMVTFYRPTKERYKILIDAPTFPSDTYAVKTHLQHHGINPCDGLIIATPRPGEHTLRTEDIESLLAREGSRIALVMLAGVNFFTGQVLDMPRLAAASRAQGCNVGFDLAHAVGNIPLALHDWNIDFAVWCSYKYLNSGPGAVAGCFVHERHGRNLDLPRFAGWWGNDPATRFKMHLLPDFIPRVGADGWQISNPPILAMAPLLASLRIFDEIGMNAVRAKSVQLTGYLKWLIDRIPAKRFEIITPADLASHGSQLSMLANDDPRGLFKRLQAAHVIADFREPNVIRVAPTALYNTFHEVWRFAQVLAQ